MYLETPTFFIFFHFSVERSSIICVNRYEIGTYNSYMFISIGILHYLLLITFSDLYRNNNLFLISRILSSNREEIKYKPERITKRFEKKRKK